jgi:hypothetical protein
MISYKKKQFHLITYNRRCIFRFNHLPLSIKDLIIDKIQERNAGIYVNIPDFTNYIKYKNIILNENENEIQSDIYNGETVFSIYNHEYKESPPPGKGNREKLDKREICKYNELHNTDEQWRAKLSNEWIQPFTLYGRKYDSVSDVIEKEKNRENIIQDAIYAKFSQHNDLQTLLKYTKNAKLVYFIPKCSPVTATILMKIRKYLCK